MKEQQLARIRQDKGVHRDLFYMCLPLLAMAFAFYGLRAVLLCGTAVIAANLSDRLVAWLRRRPYEKGEWSSEAFAFMLALILPATVSYYVVIVGAVAAVLLGKEAFGGYGCYVFHPTAVGYAVVAVSWPEQVFRYPEVQLFQSLPLGSVSGVQLVDSPLHALKTGGLPTLDNTALFLGNYAGPMGVTALLVILACALFLANRRSLHLSVMFSFLITCAVVAFVAPRLGDIPAFSMPWTYVADRLDWGIVIARELGVDVFTGFRSVGVLLEMQAIDGAMYWGNLVMLYLFLLLGMVPTVLSGLRASRQAGVVRPLQGPGPQL